MKRIILITTGFISLSIGIVGMFVPLLPTTPFLLLSAACFLRSSKTIYNWLIHHKLFSLYIKGYIKYKAISIKAKIFSLLLLWIVISITALIFNIIWLQILLFIIAVCVTIHILSLYTLTKEMVEDLRK